MVHCCTFDVTAAGLWDSMLSHTALHLMRVCLLLTQVKHVL